MWKVLLYGLFPSRSLLFKSIKVFFFSVFEKIPKDLTSGFSKIGRKKNTYCKQISLLQVCAHSSILCKAAAEQSLLFA